MSMFVYSPDFVDVILASIGDARDEYIKADARGRAGGGLQLLKLADLVRVAQDLGIYPLGTLKGNPNDVLTMVIDWGSRWIEWSGPFTCPLCEVDLRDRVTGPPFKREVHVVDRMSDRVRHIVCPDCDRVIVNRLY